MLIDVCCLRVKQKKLHGTAQYYIDKESYSTLYSKLLASEGLFFFLFFSNFIQKLPDKEKEELQVLEKKY